MFHRKIKKKEPRPGVWEGGTEVGGEGLNTEAPGERGKRGDRRSTTTKDNQRLRKAKRGMGNWKEE